MMQHTKYKSTGFTLVEMLIAMAVTLLMMIALAKSFGFVGAQVKESRADVELVNQLRDVNNRMSDEMNACTVPLITATSEYEPSGYFIYAEGPITNATSSLFRASLDDEGNLQLPESRYGDFDDYLAFTAVARGNNWFTGKVPRFVLDQKKVEERNRINGTSIVYSPANFEGDPWDAIVIRSKHAEIIYYASPEYVASSLPGSPQYVDADGDVDLNGDCDDSNNGFPDRIRLHRRVLLIRPDLNSANGFIPRRTLSVRNQNGVGTTSIPMMTADRWPTAASTSSGTVIATVNSSAVAADAWIYGMAGVHQQCDLSVRRVVNDLGLPTQLVAANSLEDLSKPQNRFGHVRVPGNVLGIGGTLPSSMPLLAMGEPMTILNATADDGSRIAPPLSPAGGIGGSVTSPVVTPRILSGFLRPEYVLGEDFSHLDANGDVWGRERISEDVLLNNLVAFDVKVFDPNAAFISSANDVDGNGSTDVSYTIKPDDAGYREALTQWLTNPGLRDEFTTGGFVDLAYPVLAGGSLRGWQSRATHALSTGTSPLFLTPQQSSVAAQMLVTPYSGLAGLSGNNFTPFQTVFYKSGRLLTQGGEIRVFQPAFDTSTNHFDRDGFLQAEGGANSVRGTRWSTVTANADTGADGLDSQVIFGTDDTNEQSVTPCFIANPEAVRVSIRIQNPATNQLRQTTVIYRD